jgi:hypothetical protein
MTITADQIAEIPESIPAFPPEQIRTSAPRRRTLRSAPAWLTPWRTAARLRALVAEQQRDIRLLILTLGDVTEQLAAAQPAQG